MVKQLIFLLITTICIFFCSQAIFADTKITDSKGNTLIYDNASHLIQIAFKPGTTSIGYEEMQGQEYLEVVVIPASVKHIEAWAFNRCYRLQLVKISRNSQLQTIGEAAFRSCINLTSINLADANGLKKIGKMAFYNCGSLMLTIPNSVTEIGTSAFNCDAWGVEIKNPRPVQHILYNGPASDDYEDKLPKQLHKWGAARRN